MTTRTEAVLFAVEVILANVQGAGEDGELVPCRVEVDRVIPFTREEAPAINLKYETEEPQQYGGPDWSGAQVVRSRTRLLVEIYVRGPRPVILAERSFEQVHARIMADPTIGGRVHAVQYAGRRWQSEDADGACGWVVASYDLVYTASERSLA
jgi:hypothetical protein